MLDLTNLLKLTTNLCHSASFRFEHSKLPLLAIVGVFFALCFTVGGLREHGMDMYDTDCKTVFAKAWDVFKQRTESLTPKQEAHWEMGKGPS